MPGGPNQLVASYTPGPDRSNYNGALGLTFTPSALMTFNKIGIRCGSGTLGQKTVVLRATSGNIELARAIIDLTGGALNQWFYADMPPITVAVGKAYVLWVGLTANDGYVYPDNLANNCTTINCSNWQAVYGTSVTSAGSPNSTHTMYHGVDLDYAVAINYVDLAGSLAV